MQCGPLSRRIATLTLVTQCATISLHAVGLPIADVAVMRRLWLGPAAGMAVAAPLRRCCQHLQGRWTALQACFDAGGESPVCLMISDFLVFNALSRALFNARVPAYG
jgi:hypothetical protein